MWLAEVPTVIVRSAIVKLPQLEAEESILATNRVALGSGTFAPDVQRTLADTWQRSSIGEADQASQPKPRPDPEHLRARGFGVRRVRKPRAV